jgi:hypothetical protein
MLAVIPVNVHDWSVIDFNGTSISNLRGQACIFNTFTPPFKSLFQEGANFSVWRQNRWIKKVLAACTRKEVCLKPRLVHLHGVSYANLFINFLCCQFILTSCLWTVIYLSMPGPYCVMTLGMLWYNDYQCCYTFVRSPVQIKAGGHSLSMIMQRFDFWHSVIIIMLFLFWPNLNKLCNWYTSKSVKSVSSWSWVYFCMAWQCEQKDKLF